MICTMRILFIATIFFFATLSYSSEVFVKIASGNNSVVTITYKKPEDISSADTRLKFIAKMIRENYFDPDNIARDYYNIVVKDGMKIYNKSVKQFEFTPITQDRFSHIITLYGNLIVRREVYDTNNNLIYAYGYTDSIPDIQPTKKETKEVSLEKEPLLYKGFKGKLVKKLEDGTVHYLFSDGLNKFSIFIKKSEKNSVVLRHVIYGNYLFSKNIDGIQYTVIGTIPFDEMENFISFITSKEKNAR